MNNLSKILISLTALVPLIGYGAAQKGVEPLYDKMVRISSEITTKSLEKATKVAPDVLDFTCKSGRFAASWGPGFWTTMGVGAGVFGIGALAYRYAGSKLNYAATVAGCGVLNLCGAVGDVAGGGAYLALEILTGRGAGQFVDLQRGEHAPEGSFDRMAFIIQKTLKSLRDRIAKLQGESHEALEDTSLGWRMAGICLATTLGMSMYLTGFEAKGPATTVTPAPVPVVNPA